MTSGATCEQCSEDDETTTNGLPSKYRQYVTLSGIDFQTRTNMCTTPTKCTAATNPLLYEVNVLGTLIYETSVGWALE